MTPDDLHDRIRGAWTAYDADGYRYASCVASVGFRTLAYEIWDHDDADGYSARLRARTATGCLSADVTADTPRKALAAALDEYEDAIEAMLGTIHPDELEAE